MGPKLLLFSSSLRLGLVVLTLSPRVTKGNELRPPTNFYQARPETLISSDVGDHAVMRSVVCLLLHLWKPAKAKRPGIHLGQLEPVLVSSGLQ